jgi:hypothetical protein
MQMIRKFTIAIVSPAGLTDDTVYHFIASSNYTLLHVSAYCYNNDSTLKIGDDTDDELHLAEQTLTAGTAVEFERADFVPLDPLTQTRQFPRITRGDTITVTLDGSLAPEHVTIILTFAEG